MNGARSLSDAAFLELYRKMVLIRQFEDRLYQLFLQGLVPGTLHQYQGQEAVAVGVCAALNPDDVVFSTHRPVGHAIAKGVPLEAIAGELWGKTTGCAAGKGGQMHLTDVSVGFMPSNAVVGANIPISVGAAVGFAIRGMPKVAVSFFGDGASNTGAFHEGLNFAAVQEAPVIFVCENNQYGASTHISSVMKLEDIADRAAAYGFPGEVVDGMDVGAVYASMKEAVDRARKGGGPTLLEYKTYRFMGHSRGDPAHYRSALELNTWRQRDPIVIFRSRLKNEYGFKERQLINIEKRCQEETKAAIEKAQVAPDPSPEELLHPVFWKGL